MRRWATGALAFALLAGAAPSSSPPPDGGDAPGETTLRAKKWKFADWFNRARRAFPSEWRVLFGDDGMRGALIDCALAPDGVVKGVTVERSSGSPALDTDAVAATHKAAASFGPPPAALVDTDGKMHVRLLLNKTTKVTRMQDLASSVGSVITLEGVVERSKIPTLLGVDVAEPASADAGQRLVATGRLERYSIAPRDPGEPIAATRGPGTYYRLIDPQTGRLAQPRRP